MNPCILNQVKHRYIESPIGPLHALDFGGTGRPLLCLHGVTGTAWGWHDVVAGLADRRSVAIDMRGHGDSAWSSAGAYETSEHVLDLERHVASLGEDTVDLVGSSWGALVALEYAAANPDRVHYLVLVDVEPSFEQSETDVFPRPTSFESFDAARRWLAESNPRAPETAIDAMTFGSMHRNSEGMVVPRHDPVFFERWPFRNGDHWDALERLECPTLLVHAGHSFVRAEVMLEMSERIADSQLVVIAESGHVVPVDNPAALAAELRTFLD